MGIIYLNNYYLFEKQLCFLKYISYFKETYLLKMYDFRDVIDFILII